MSMFDMFFVGYVMAAMLALMGVLAWATFYTREAKRPARAPERQPVQLTPAKRPSEDVTAQTA